MPLGQATPTTARIAASDRRPLAAALVELQQHYKVPLNYENAAYAYSPELAEKRNDVSFEVPLGADSFVADPDAALQVAVSAYLAVSTGSEYRIRKANGQYYVEPAFQRDAAGNRVPANSILDQPVTLPSGQSAPAALLDAVLNQVGASCRCRVGVGNIPLNGFLNGKKTIGVLPPIPARDALALIFAAVAPITTPDGRETTSMAYRLLFDAGTKEHVLNVRMAVPSERALVDATGTGIPVQQTPGTDPGNRWFRLK